ncbi:VOC family protein [Bowmanella yangjiangensis]|uniref:VOC family protein n=1 Tax=Bowmanella yangjiangensis TaxID=2811230 RepID=A0ABS3CWS4_9ALTE|nr:VOC family protein [Bowmanella yangjiangensis]MBN7821573.1 VOC family protein [Bowmanella yangjiangensis]
MIFRYTILYVENVADTLAFYQQALGLETGFLHESGDYGELVTGETKLAFSSHHLMQSLGKHPQHPNPERPVFEIAFETQDVAGALQKAKQAGAKIVQDVREEPWGQTTAYILDINGYLVEICSSVQLPSPE